MAYDAGGGSGLKGKGMFKSFAAEGSKFASNFKGLPGNFSKDVSGMMSDLGGNVFGGLLNKFKGFGGGSVFKQFSNSGVNVTSMASLLSKNARELDLDLASGAADTVMKNDPFKFTSVMYPRDLTVDKSVGSYIQFYINVQNITKYNFRTPTGGTTGGTKTTQVSKPIMTSTTVGEPGKQTTTWKQTGTEEVQVVEEGGSDLTFQDDLHNPVVGTAGPKGFINKSDQTQLFMNKRKRQYGLTSVYQPTTRIAHSCSIYLPNQQDNLSMSYNTHETGLVGFALAAAFKGAKAFNEEDYKKTAEIGLGATFQAILESAKNVGLGIAEGLTSAEGGYELLQKVYGRAQNPYLEVLFNAPEMRTFTYNFTFAPRNEEETRDVQNIIKLFRFHMSPELRDDHNMFVTLPSEFDIYYMYVGSDNTVKEDPYVNKISTCVLTNCTVDYTPTGVKKHTDGSPVVIKMGLTFQEMDMMTKSHVAEGF